MADTPSGPQSRLDVTSTWSLALGLLVRRPVVSALCAATISLAAFFTARVAVRGVDFSSFSPGAYHLVMILRASAVALVAALFALPLLVRAGLAPDRSQGRSMPAFAGRTVVAVFLTIGATEPTVASTDLANATIGGVDGFDAWDIFSLILELPTLIALHAAFAAASLVGLPDALLGQPRTPHQGEGPHLFLACLLPFGVAGCAEAVIWLVAPGAATLPRILTVAFALDAAAMLFAILLAFATHSHFAPNAAAAKIAAAFD